MAAKPSKKTDKMLWGLVELKIQRTDYIFMNHAKQRQRDRCVSDIEVLNILINKKGCKRRRNKGKDTYYPGYEDWNYCIEGMDIDKNKIRVIISFNIECMLVITVIRLEE